jgi:hypothetical protein
MDTKKTTLIFHIPVRQCRDRNLFLDGGQLSGKAKVFQDAFAVDKLLGDDACDAKHGKAAVVELSCAESVELLGIRRLQAKRIESKITVDIAVLEFSNN